MYIKRKKKSLSGLQACIIKNKFIQFEMRPCFFLSNQCHNSFLTQRDSALCKHIIPHEEKPHSVLFCQVNLYKSYPFAGGRSNFADADLPQVD